MKIYKTIIVPIHTTKNNIEYFYKCNKESVRVWNECVRLDKYLWEKEKKFADRKYLQDRLKGSFSIELTAKGIQMVAYKYLAATSCIQKAKKNGRTDLKYPYKHKKFFNTFYTEQQLQINYEKHTIRIPRPEKIVYGKRMLKPIFLKIKSMPQNIRQIEIIYKNELKLAINYYEEIECLQMKSNNICAIDFGEIHSISSIDNKGNNSIITGRKVRSNQRFRNKELSKLERKLSHCKKGSRNYKKYRNAIRKLTTKSSNIINDNLKKTAKLFTNYVFNNDIKTVVIGDLKNFNKNQKYTKGKKGSRQKLIQWQHGKLIIKLHNNLDKYGVKIKEISERYTSQTCPNCGHKHKPIGRNYVCSKCSFTMHRDIVGAYNILSKYLNNGKIRSMNVKVKPLKYLRIA